MSINRFNQTHMDLIELYNRYYLPIEVYCVNAIYYFKSIPDRKDQVYVTQQQINSWYTKKTQQQLRSQLPDHLQHKAFRHPVECWGVDPFDDEPILLRGEEATEQDIVAMIDTGKKWFKIHHCGPLPNY